LARQKDDARSIRLRNKQICRSIAENPAIAQDDLDELSLTKKDDHIIAEGSEEKD
jgi:hypothetical protein